MFLNSTTFIFMNMLSSINLIQFEKLGIVKCEFNFLKGGQKRQISVK